MFPAKHFFSQHVREANSSVVMNPQCFKVPDSYWAASASMFGGMECRCSFEEGECKASAGFSPETINLQDRCWH